MTSCILRSKTGDGNDTALDVYRFPGDSPEDWIGDIQQGGRGWIARRDDETDIEAETTTLADALAYVTAW